MIYYSVAEWALWHNTTTAKLVEYNTSRQVARLLDRTNPGCRDGETGDYPLTAAIRHGQWNVVILLLECDKRVISSINSRSKDLHTPLLLLLLRNASAFDIPAVSPGRRPAGKAMFATQSTASTSPTFRESSGMWSHSEKTLAMWLYSRMNLWC